MNQPDPAEIEARLETARKYPYNAYAKFYAHDIPTLLAALATAEERAETAERSERTNRWYVGDEPMLKAKLAAAAAVVEAAKPISKWLGKGIGGENNAKKLFDALASYHKATGPQAETENG